MHVAVALLQWIGVGGCGCPSSYKLSLTMLDSFAFMNSAPSSSSAANAAKKVSI